MAVENVKDFFEKNIPERIKTSPDTAKNINSVYEFNITGSNGGVWTVDLTKGQESEVKAGSGGAAKCTVTCTEADFLQILNKKLNAQMAFMSGKLKIKGDMGLAMKLQKLLG